LIKLLKLNFQGNLKLISFEHIQFISRGKRSNSLLVKLPFYIKWCLAKKNQALQTSSMTTRTTTTTNPFLIVVSFGTTQKCEKMSATEK